jgi:hypothetical protein
MNKQVFSGRICDGQTNQEASARLKEHVIVRKIGLAANPMVILVAAAMYTIAGVGSALFLSAMYAPIAGLSEHGSSVELNRLLAHPWASLLIGVLFGIPLAVRSKYSLRKYRDYHAESAILTRAERKRRPIHRPSVVDCLFVVGAPGLAAYFAAYVFQIAWLPAFWGPGILLILAYPEQKAIYKAALARLSESR